MTREEHLYSMRMQELVMVADKLGIKINTKAAKSQAIEKILAAEKMNEKEITKEKAENDAYVAEVMQQKKDLNIECLKIESYELVNEDTCADGTTYTEIGKEIAEQAKQKAAVAVKPERKRGAKIEYNGKSQNICAWAKELNVSANTLYSRIYILGWDVEKAFTHKGKKS